MYIERKLSNKIKSLKKSVLLIGPRQTGKSTFLKSLDPDLEINLANEETFLSFSSDPGRLKKLIGKNKIILVDEVQRLPSILNTIQYLIDSDKSRRFLLSGSSARKLKRGQANLLPGRIHSYQLGTFTLEELKDRFDIEKALKIGLLPGVYLEESLPVAEKTLQTYAGVYLREEIQAEALTRNLEGFSRFFKIVSSRSGDFIDFTKFSSQAMIERMSAKRYFDILCDTLVLNSIEPFTKSSKRRLIQHPKFYFFDVGVLNGTLDNFQVSEDRIGSLFEHLFLQLVISTAHSRDISINVSVYRTEAGAEVDFIIEIGREIFAVEVKATKRIGTHDLRGLKSFADFYGKKHRAMLIYLGDEELDFNGVEVLPLIQGLETLFGEI